MPAFFLLAPYRVSRREVDWAFGLSHPQNMCVMRVPILYTECNRLIRPHVIIYYVAAARNRAVGRSRVFTVRTLKVWNETIEKRDYTIIHRAQYILRIVRPVGIYIIRTHTSIAGIYFKYLRVFHVRFRRF